MKPKGKSVHRKKTAFLKAFEACGNISQAARVAKVARNNHYDWMEDDEYKKRFRESEVRAARALEDEAVFRATEGLRRYKFDKNGEPIIDPVTKEPYYESQRSDTLLIFLLKGILPEKYRERYEAHVTADVSHSGTVRIVEDTDWYGNSDRITPEAIAASSAGVDVAGPVQGVGVRKAVGQNGNGATSNGKGTRTRKRKPKGGD
jgi:hypothetical protein